MDQIKYLALSWQAFIQYMIDCFNKGYFYYHFNTHPEQRRHKLPEIDKKIINRFEIGLSKDRRYRRKKKGQANYTYLRHELMFVILRTDGDDLCSERANQRFDDIRTKPLIISIGGEIQLKLHKKADTGYTVCLSKACYRDIKTKLLELAEHRQIKQMHYWFNALNGIPAYAGMIEHKRQLLKAVLQISKKHGTALKRSDFRLNTRLQKYKVFK